MKQLIALTLAVGLCLFGLAADSLADGASTCAGAAPVIADGTAYINSFDPTYYLVEVEEGRSYAIEVYSKDGTSTEGLVYGDNTCTTPYPVQYMNTSLPKTTGGDTRRRTFIAAADDVYVRVTNAGSRFRIVETTIYCPYYYVGGDFNSFVIMQNTSAANLSYTLTAWSLAGSATTPISSDTLTADATTLVNLRNYPTPATNGSVRIAHTGPYGALRVHLANQSPTATVSVMADCSERPVYNGGS